MTFTPPTFPILRSDTLNLDIVYSTLLGRYTISPPIESSLPASSSDLVPTVKSNSLEILIARTHAVITCGSERASSIEVFNLLSNECRDLLREKDEHKMKEGTLILLGSLFHRYFRLLKEYDFSNSYTSYLFTPFDERNCKLFTSIRQALNLPAEMPKDYRVRDLQVLDPTTVVTALKAFSDHMKFKDKYLKYPHFAKDKNFVPYLSDIIQEHTVRGSAVLKQFNAINFIQSLVRQVELVSEKAEVVLVNWCAQLAKDYKEFSSQLTIPLIEEHLKKNMDAGPIRENILDLIYTPAIVDNFSTMDHPKFLEELKKCNSDLASHRVVGGYGLLFQTKFVTQNLTFCMEKALGLHNKPLDLDAKPPVFTDADMLNGILFLKQFLSNNPDVVLDYEVFGDKGHMNTLILQYEMALTQKTQEPTVDKTTLTV
jgi:hypothetical protein